MCIRDSINAARFYTAKINVTATGLTAPEITSVVHMKRPDGSAYGGKAQGAKDIPDPEAIRYRADTDTPVSYTHLDVYKRQLVNGFCDRFSMAVARVINDSD